MENALIKMRKTTIGTEEVNSVDAREKNQPYQALASRGLFEYKMNRIGIAHGVTYITSKGQVSLADGILEHFWNC